MKTYKKFTIKQSENQAETGDCGGGTEIHSINRSKQIKKSLQGVVVPEVVLYCILYRQLVKFCREKKRRSFEIKVLIKFEGS